MPEPLTSELLLSHWPQDPAFTTPPANALPPVDPDLQDLLLGEIAHVASQKDVDPSLRAARVRAIALAL